MRWSSSLDQEDSKDKTDSSAAEQQCGAAEEADSTMFLFTPVPVKAEEHEEELQASQLHQRPSKQTEAGAAGEQEDCRRAGAAPDRNLQPETEVKSEDSSGAETDDSDDWRETREHQTSLDSLGCGGISHGARSCKNQALDEDHLSQQMMVNNGAHRRPKQEESVSPLIKEEQEEVWISQDRSSSVTFTSAAVKSEDEEEKPQPSQLHEKQHEQMETRAECGETLLGNQNLIKHMRIHTGEKPFSCSFCSKTFAQEENLQTKRHMCLDGQVSDLQQNQNEKDAEPGAAGVDHWRVKLESDSDPKRHLQAETEVTMNGPHETDDSGDSDFWTETRQRRPNEDKANVERPKAPRRTYDCSVCGKKFLWHQNLTQHMRRHTGEKPFGCSLCGKRFAQKGNLTRHLVVHVKEKPFSCVECGKKFKEISYMKRHMATHRGEKPLSCRVCLQRFSWYNQLKRHACFGGQSSELHQNINKETEKAEPGADGELHKGKEQDSDSNSKIHLHPETEVMLEHSGSDDSADRDSLTESKEEQPGDISMKKKKKSHGCSECGKRFFGNHNLIHHMRVHTGEKPFSCSFCSKTFAQKGNLTRHLMVHAKEKPFSCFECGKKFREISYMKRHMAIHKGEKPLCCKVCSQRFSWYYQLRRHKCAGGQSSELIEPGADEEEHRRVKLDTTSDQKRHLQPESEVRINEPHGTDDSGDSDFWTEIRRRPPNKEKSQDERLKASRRTYDCSECGKRFKLKRLLTQHMRRHTGEKPFSCSICSKSFKHKSYLNLHMAHHRGEKPFSCSLCDQSFTWNYQLQRHRCETGLDPEPHLNQTERKLEAGRSERARKSDPERRLRPDAKVKTEDFSGSETDDSDEDWGRTETVRRV